MTHIFFPDDPDPLEEFSDTELVAPVSRVVNDITIQSHRLARMVDRLPDGEYTIEIVKRSRLEPWQARLMDGQNVIRTIDLFR